MQIRVARQFSALSGWAFIGTTIQLIRRLLFAERFTVLEILGPDQANMALAHAIACMSIFGQSPISESDQRW